MHERRITVGVCPPLPASVQKRCSPGHSGTRCLFKAVYKRLFRQVSSSPATTTARWSRTITTMQRDYMKYAVWFVRLLFAAWMIPAGLNHFVPLFPQPMGSQPLSQELIRALLDSHLFD